MAVTTPTTSHPQAPHHHLPQVDLRANLTNLKWNQFMNIDFKY